MMSRYVNRWLDQHVPVHLEDQVCWQDVKVDSRQVTLGDTFFALAPQEQQQKKHITEALQKGAAFVVKDSQQTNVDLSYLSTAEGQVPCLSVPDLKQLHGHLLAQFYGLPSAQMVMIGVTGTNGKTSVVHLLSECLSRMQQRCGTIGTLGHGLFGQTLESTAYTTPDALGLQKILHDLVNQDAGYCAMEVSSHAIDQSRITGVHFDVAVLTNTSQDHLDYHGNMQAYRQCKAKLFSGLSLKHRVLNLDDELGEMLYLTGHRSAQTAAYTFYQMGARHDVAYCQVLSQELDHQVIQVCYRGKTHDISTCLPGKHNAENVVAVFLTLLSTGLPEEAVIQALGQCGNIPGRFEVLKQAGQSTVVVDYAHTPDALRHVLQTVKQLSRQRIWCVFGCGGERDRGKRSLMGSIAEQYADQVVLTSDNPRGEDPLLIIDDVLSGLSTPWTVHVEPDRFQAIHYALSHAKAEDVVVLAGKGHERFQIINNEKIPFVDSDMVRSYYEQFHAD